MTLFVVALVTILVLEYHFDASVEMDLAANYAGDVQAYHLAMAGVRFAQALLQRDNPKADGPDDSWYKLGLVPACFSPQQLIELATAGLGEGAATEGRETGTAVEQTRCRMARGGRAVSVCELRTRIASCPSMPSCHRMRENTATNSMGQHFSEVF